MKFNRNEHSRFVQLLDRTAEKNPLLWLPCILLLIIAMRAEQLGGTVKVAFSHREKACEDSVKANVQLARKPFALRIVALSLVMALSFMFVPNLSEIISFNAFANESSEDGFDVYMFIADDIIFDRSDDNDDTNFYSDYAKHTMDYYFNDFRSMSEIWMDCMTPEFENNVKAWETTNLVLSPGDIGKKMVDAREYYVTIILSMMNSSYESDTILNDLYSSNTKNGGKILKQFSEFYKEYTKCDLKDFLNQSSYTDEEKAMLESVQKEWLKENKWVKDIKAADDIVKILKTANNMQDYVDSFISYCQISNVCAEWKDIINYMYNNCDRNNYALISALESFKSYMESDDMTNAAFNMLVEKGVNDFASWGISKCVGEVTKLITDRFPAFSGIKIGTALGKTLSNMLTGTDKIVEEYQMVKAYSELMNLLRGAYKKAESTYINNRTSQNACAFLSYVNIYYTALHVGNDYGKEFADAICNGGIINKIMYSKGQYEEYVKHHKNFANYITWANETVTTYWIHNLYWYDLGLYEIYAPLIKNMSYIDPTRVEFEKDSVEWGLEDVEFNGAKYTVYPNEATNKEVIITSSDESVATLDNYGNVKVFKAGTCQITVTTFMNEFVSDTLNVTVVEGHGADSVALPDIIPIIPDVMDNSNYEYTITKNEITIDKYVGTDTEVVVPNMIMGKAVTSIGCEAFANRTDITSITIPEGVTSINSANRSSHSFAPNYKWGTFYGCNMLETVLLPETLNSIGACAFWKCSNLKNITIPESVASIETSAFSECSNLTNINIPNSVTSIGYWAFEDCTSLKSITIPDNVTSISDGAFDGCISLTSITIPNSVTSIGGSAFYGCASLTSITIPNSVTSIGGSAFYGCASLTSITIPDSVTSIGNSAFSGCTGLTSITIPDSVTSIGYWAFKNCTSLINITIPNSVTSIDNSAFENCTSLTNITIPNNVTSIGNSAFKNCTSLTNITIPNSVISIGEDAFLSCKSLINITIPNSVTSIGDGAFSSCTELISITIPSSVTSIGDWAFSGCKNLTSITIPNSVTSLGSWSFNGFTHLENITLPNCVTSIGKEAFRNCTSLTDITIPNNVTSIGDWAFSDCTNLKSIAIPDGVTSIGDLAFSGCKNLTSITIPNSVTSLGRWSFEGFTNLKSITLPNSVTYINYDSFKNCSSLESIAIPNGVTLIGHNAFENCTNLTTVTISNNESE